MSTNCRPNQNIMKKIRKKPNWQIKLKCAGCEEMCNDNFSVYTCYITYCCICWAIDKQLYLYLIAMGHIEGLFVSWKLRLAREWRCHTFLYLSSSLAVWTNAGGNFLTMFDKLTVLQEATIQKKRYKCQSRRQWPYDNKTWAIISSFNLYYFDS